MNNSIVKFLNQNYLKLSNLLIKPHLLCVIVLRYDNAFSAGYQQKHQVTVISTNEVRRNLVFKSKISRRFAPRDDRDEIVYLH